MKLSALFLNLILSSLCINSIVAQETTKHRVIILTDIEADPDDTQSMVRLLLYANQIDIKGIIATTSVWQKTKVHPESVIKIINAYGKVQANLNKHETGFPEASSLLALVTHGLPKYGMLGVGKGQDSEGSNRIIKELEKNDPRPLYISVWGGVNTLSQALYTLKDTKSKAELKRLLDKLRVYTISDQDDSGIWIRNTFPELFYIVSPGDDYGTSTWSAINSEIKGLPNTEISNSWLAEHIQQGHGPLGAVYPDVAWGMEGDTPSFLSLIPNGLNNPEHPNWGGWGGRYELYKPDVSKLKKGPSDVPLAPETRAIWTDASDDYIPFGFSEFGRVVKKDSTKTYHDNKATLWRWRTDFQNDFAARMDWCLADYAHANHAPVPVLSSPENITVKSGESFSFDASNSYDPDGDSFGFVWYHYPQAGTYKKEVVITPENFPGFTATAPIVDKQETLHIILKMTDKGTPNLTRYKRMIVTVVPK
ncbi:nucleoside hydrolase-like domain-containing protein [Confluentibacter sediminis]|uniref:nucleoside hydrolase-like domain-containing protein n=1 Tax=Confluentibacter sediminis TaxID=2219045 RepID=UPI000DADFAC6|nr:nucleoside hydrolase-like domain-containing protein [Confluentibacter sediminis]